MNQDYLPPIHREDGLRPKHDDYRIGKVPLWPFNLIPRWVDARPITGIPYKVLGSSDFWVRNSYPYEEMLSDKCPGPNWAPKPLLKKGHKTTWQLTMVPTNIFGKSVHLPYFAINFKNGLHIRFGLARLSDDYSVEEGKNYWYSKLLPLAIRRIK